MNPSPSSTTRRFAKNSLFPSFSLLACLVCLTASLKAQFSGNYSGTAWGDVDGVWSMTVAGTGSISGRIVEEDGGLIYPVSGAVNASGAFTLVVSGFPDASFGGTISSSGVVNGSWSDPSLGASGEFEGSRLPVGSSPYAGSYSGNATDDLGNPVGTWTATVSSVGNWDGTGILFGGGTYRIAGIVGAAGYIDVCIQEGGTMNGQIDATGDIAGDWTDFWDSGTFVGWRINPSGPEILVEQPAGTGITDGGTLDFGTLPNSTSNTITFTIINRGAYSLTGLAISKNGTHAADFTVGTLGATSLVTGASTTFAVTFAPGAAGSRTAALHIASNDADENPFDINLIGSETVPPLALGELVAPRIAITGSNVNLTVQPSVAGRSYQLQVSDTLASGSWLDLGAVRRGDGNNMVISIPYVPAVSRRFYRLVLVGVATVPPGPDGFALIPAGLFQMGDQSNPQVGYTNELPAHPVLVSAFYMGKCEVTKKDWDEVRAWGLLNGYPDLVTGEGKHPSHPVHSISWYDALKWCNARSEMEGLTPCYEGGTAIDDVYRSSDSITIICRWTANGYRLPGEAEWEKAARGGLIGQMFPWGNSITHSYANFRNVGGEPYQAGTTGFHPLWSNNDDGNYPYTSPVGSFAPNGYGLHDMAGNLWEWCWDGEHGYWLDMPQDDPRGDALPPGNYNVLRGGCWGDPWGSYWNGNADTCRVSRRRYLYGVVSTENLGFRLARSVVP